MSDLVFKLDFYRSVLQITGDSFRHCGTIDLFPLVLGQRRPPGRLWSSIHVELSIPVHERFSG